MNTIPERDAEEQFVHLLTTHHDRLLRFVKTLVPHATDAEDVFQRGSVSLWKKHDEYDSSQPFFPWACRFLHFEVLNYRKKAARDRLTFSEDLVELLATETLEEQPVLEQRTAALESCLAKLRDSDHKILHRRYAERDTVADLASELGVPPRKLYKTLENLKRKLSLCLDRALASSPHSAK